MEQVEFHVTETEIVINEMIKTKILMICFCSASPVLVGIACSTLFVHKQDVFYVFGFEVAPSTFQSNSIC